MNNKNLRKTESKKQVRNDAKKSKKRIPEHHKQEIISEEEVEKRKGFTGDHTEILSAFLHKLDGNESHLNFSKKLKDLATYIYEMKILYVHRKGEFKLMELSSIDTELSNIRRAERERMEELKEELGKEQKKHW